MQVPGVINQLDAYDKVSVARALSLALSLSLSLSLVRLTPATKIEKAEKTEVPVEIFTVCIAASRRYPSGNLWCVCWGCRLAAVKRPMR